MKLGKDLALMGMGAGAILLYQKYGAPMMKKAEKAINKTMKKMDNKIDQMM